MNLELKKIRNERGYTIKQMAAKLKVSQAFYCQIENNKRNLSYLMAVKIATILDLKPDDLFYKDFKKRI